MFRPDEQCYAVQHLEILTFVMDAVNEWDFGLSHSRGDKQMEGRTKQIGGAIRRD